MGQPSVTEAVNTHQQDAQQRRRDFLRALYGTSPDALYFEMRCIHPGTGEVKLFWSRVGDKPELAILFRQVERLNEEGFGIFFAPCLRREKRGSAEAAALLPALWIDIDCDGNDAQREQGLNRLLEFSPAPSYIVDSGGGWHAYWLLDMPHALDDEAERAKVADVLRGLFAALGGDAAYAKSVASVMRLPESLNTKPGRNGARAEIIEADATRRYPLSAFAWLASPGPQPEQNGARSQAVNGSAHHAPLPERTMLYLTAGATNGQRNAELFAAACQMRDAGLSQSDAERELVARYVADGGAGENHAAREKEAHATITSAYKQPPREPIQAPPQSARERVRELVGSFSADQAQKRPSAEQISEAVRACATLNAVEWAEERRQLKALCGEGLRLTDLDRLYREARRDLERSQQPELRNGPQYAEVDGHMLFEKITERGMMRQTIAEWAGRVTEWITLVNDDGQADHIMRLELRHEERTQTIDVPSELFGDPNALQRFITQKAGGIYTSCASMHRHLPSAILKLSGPLPRRQTYRFMGWTQIDGRWIYVSPQTAIGAAGPLEQPPEVDLESRLRDYGLQEHDWDASLSAFAAALAVMPRSLAPVLIAFTLLPVLQRFFPEATPKPALHLVGTTGSGKSEIAALMSSFYGRFHRDTPPAQWGDTVNMVEVLGYSLSNALYWVDDFKTVYADDRSFARFMQSYSRTMGRGRLTREARLREDRPCRGLLLSTGETTIEGEPSVLSRMLVLEVPPWEARDPGGAALRRANDQRGALVGFTARFIQWIAEQADAGTLAKRLAARYEQNARGYDLQLRSRLQRQAHTGRMIQNWAVLVTVYQLLDEFLTALDVDDTLPAWQDSIVEAVEAVQDERPGQVFLNLLGQLIAGGQCVIADSLRQPADPAPGTTIIGYRDEGYVYLLPEIAYREVTRIQPLKFTAHSIGAQLKEDGVLVPNPGDSHLGVQVRTHSGRVRLWRFNADSLGGDSGDSGTMRSSLQESS